MGGIAQARRLVSLVEILCIHHAKKRCRFGGRFSVVSSAAWSSKSPCAELGENANASLTRRVLRHSSHVNGDRVSVTMLLPRTSIIVRWHRYN